MKSLLAGSMLALDNSGVGKERHSLDPEVLREIEASLRAARSGEESALGRLYELSSARIFRFCVYLTGDRDSAQELCQESYLKAFSSIHSLKESAAFLRWLTVIARNLYLDRIRALRPGQDGSQVDIEEIGELATVASDPNTVLQVQSSVMMLNSSDRALLGLVHLEGYSYKEAAEVLGISEEKVRARIHDARKRFIKFFESE